MLESSFFGGGFSVSGKVTAVVLFPLYFQRANASFVAGRFSGDVLRDELRRWSRWHWVRSGLSIAAAGMALGAL